MIKVGFIGIGLMGLPMAKNILKAGYNLKAFNRSQNKALVLKEFGAEITTSIDEVVKDSDVIITMLTDDTAINEVMGSPNFLENLKSSSTVIDMSSVKPTTATKYGNNLKSKNIKYLDAPVSGGTIGAEEASLAIMVGGEQDVFNEVLDLLKSMGNPTLVGPVGSGQVSKLANQIIVGLTIGAVAEAVTLCEKAGANPDKMIKALSGGWVKLITKTIATEAIVSVALFGSANAKTLKIETHFTASSPNGEVAAQFAKNVEMFSGGSLKVQMFYSSSVTGKSAEVFNSVSATDSLALLGELLTWLL